jgi:acyl-CoA thioester hydrolase
MSFSIAVTWAQLDANGHLRHSAYADIAAQARMDELNQLGITFEYLKAQNIGPVLFREETIYYREVQANDVVTVTTKLSKSRADGSRFSFHHELFRQDGVKAAEINLDGAWLDLTKRKLATPTKEFTQRLLSMERTADYIEELKG